MKLNAGDQGKRGAASDPDPDPGTHEAPTGPTAAASTSHPTTPMRGGRRYAAALDTTKQGDGDTLAPSFGPGASRPPAPLQYRDPSRYQIMGEHGRGGLGLVFRARDKELGRDVALKELLGRGHSAELRFFREALITARLEHPGIVPVHEAGRWPDGTPFYAMKLVAGRSLATLVADAGSLDARLALIPHVIAVADAIAYAHDRKIIHRDLKPSNVIVGDFGETIVIDWGIAKDLTAVVEDVADAGPYRTPAGHEGLTVDGAILGTPVYMAPEQAAGDVVDARTDVYAIGMILYELCTGSATSLPLLEKSFDSSMRQVDRDLATIVRKSLSIDPGDRYRDAAALSADLKAFESGARIAARRYSLAGVLRHWITRHKRVAIAIAASTAVATLAAVLSISEIVAQRDRADRARRDAETERDRAVLSEASALLDKDPTRARDLLNGLEARTPQYAWLLSRATQDAAAHVVRVRGQISNLIVDPATSRVGALTQGSELYSVDTSAGTARLVDRDLTGPLTRGEPSWLYARWPAPSQPVTLVGARGGRVIDVGHLLAQPSSTLLSPRGGIFDLEPSGDLYQLEGERPVVLRRGVRSIAADGDLFLLCTEDGALEVTRAGQSILRTRCGKIASPRPMAAAGGHFAALLDDHTLVLDRGAASVEVPIALTGEYELALSATGLLAVADYNDKTWLVRAGRDRAELGPLYTSQPTSVAAGGRYAAWGYADGTVIAIDTSTDKTWRFRGHDERVEYIAIDDAHQRAISSGGSELRIWDLGPRAWEARARAIGPVQCEVLNQAVSPDGRQVAFDCTDGSVRAWSRGPGTLRVLHRHDGVAFGLTWLRGMVCSGGWDGRVLCSAADGSATREVLSGDGRIRWLTAGPDHDYLAIATNSSHVYKYDGRLQELYSHDDTPHRLAISPDGRWLASIAYDGQLIVYDLAGRRVRSRALAHAKQATTVAWSGGALWTAGVDGAVKRWAVQGGEARLEQATSEAGPVKYLRPFRGGWAATVGGKTLVVTDPAIASAPVRLDLGRPIFGVEVSPDERFVAAASTGEVLVLDRRHHSIARLFTGKQTPAFAGFPDSTSLVIGTPTAMTLVPIDALDYVPFDLIDKRSHHAEEGE